MKTTIMVILCCGLAIAMVATPGCEKKEGGEASKPIEQVQKEVEKMDVDALRAKANKIKDAIADKQGDLEGIAKKLKEFSPTEMLGDDAKKVKAEMDDLTKAIKDLKAQLDVYISKLKEKGADVTGLDI